MSPQPLPLPGFRSSALPILCPVCVPAYVARPTGTGAAKGRDTRWAWLRGLAPGSLRRSALLLLGIGVLLGGAFGSLRLDTPLSFRLRSTLRSTEPWVPTLKAR